MKQNSIADYLSCIVFKVVSSFVFFLPLNFSLFCGRRLGDFICFFDRRHRATAYANIKRTVADGLDCASASRITRRAYRAFGQNLMEIAVIPRINGKYLRKYIRIENLDFVREAFERGKGVIFLIVHEGNWELSNIICANLGFPFVLFVRDQGFPRLNALLNAYRLRLGAKIIHKDTGIRQLVEVLQENQSIGMTVDQGGRKGYPVEFFGREASMSTGAVKLALKHDCAIIPVFYRRVKGPYIDIILDQVFTVTRKSGSPDADLGDNLRRLFVIYEKYLRQYPHEYLWTYKIYKYSKEKELLIISDSKTGHLRQSEGASGIVKRRLEKDGVKTRILIREIKFRSRFFEIFSNFISAFCGKYPGGGAAMRYLRYALTPESWRGLMDSKPDIVVSAGSSTSAVNYLLAREYQAKSIVLMRPVISLKKFDLAIIPRHDYPEGYGLASFCRSRWPEGRCPASDSRSKWPEDNLSCRKKNVVITEGALNLIDTDYLKDKAGGLEKSGLLKELPRGPRIGLLIGGDSKKFRLHPETIRFLCGQVKKAAGNFNAGVLVSTSRRTPPAVEEAIEEEFKGYPGCGALVIANRNNHPDALGGILGLSDIIVSSPESISMISEAACAGKYVVVFDSADLSAKHRRFLDNFSRRGYIYLKPVEEIFGCIERLLKERPAVSLPEDVLMVNEGLGKIL